MALLPWDLRARLEREAPTHFEAPTGTMLAIDYEAEQGPTIAVRLQELFGLNSHPSIAKGAVPLVLELLSPAHRPVQVTRDLPGFWRGSYAAVRSDLRGRYPRHPWPEDPASAMPTRRVKPRGRNARCHYRARPGNTLAWRKRFAKLMDTRVKPAYDAPFVNASLILFAKMAAFAAAVSRGLAATW